MFIELFHIYPYTLIFLTFSISLWGPHEEQGSHMCPLGAYSRPTERLFVSAQPLIPPARPRPQVRAGPTQGGNTYSGTSPKPSRGWACGIDLGIVSGGVLHVAFLDHPNTQEAPGVRRKSERCPGRLRFPNEVDSMDLQSHPVVGGTEAIMNVAHSW